MESDSLAVCRILHVLIVTQGIQTIMLEFGLETFIILTCQVSLNLCGAFGEPPKGCVPTLREQMQKHWPSTK